MPKIDLGLIGRRTEPRLFHYSWKDAALYALAVGAGAAELAHVYEGAPGGLKVLPGFCVVPALHAWPDLGADFEWPLALHGEQRTRWHRELPPEGPIVQQGEIVDIADKGKGALIRVRIAARLPTGPPLFDAEWSLFYLGAGGFGGPPGPKTESIAPPEGAAPDFRAVWEIPENQAALYRLCGDLNPLHIDPAAAARAGFERPILHGLCTYGFAVRAIVREALHGRVAGLKEFNARFAAPVYPGETLTVEGWRVAAGWVIEGRTPSAVVLKNGFARVD